MNIPCHKHCPDREIGCHSSCERYKEYRGYRDFIISERARDKQVRDYDVDTSRRLKKRR